MTATKKIKTKTLVLIIVLYTFFTNLSDIKNGLADGWNAASHQKPGSLNTRN